MGVDVDEAGRDDAAGRIDRLPGVLVDLADGDDAAVLDADIGANARAPGAVDHGAAADLKVEHVVSYLPAAPISRRRLIFPARAVESGPVAIVAQFRVDPKSSGAACTIPSLPSRATAGDG